MSAAPDTDLFLWTLSWDVHALARQPSSVFDANIFHPERRTLAYSENLLGSAPLAAPVIWITGNPVLAMNLVVLLATVLCGAGAYLLAHRLGIGIVRRRAVRPHLRVLAAALPAAGSVPSRDNPVDPVRPRVLARVPGVGPAPRRGADRGLLHAAGSLERPRRRVSAARDARRRRVPARAPRSAGVSGRDSGSGFAAALLVPDRARAVAVPRGAAGDGPQAVARGLVGAMGELPGLVIARGHVVCCRSCHHGGSTT